jgi:hypothetical protein
LIDTENDAKLHRVSVEVSCCCCCCCC